MVLFTNFLQICVTLEPVEHNLHWSQSNAMVQGICLISFYHQMHFFGLIESMRFVKKSVISVTLCMPHLVISQFVWNEKWRHFCEVKMLHIRYLISFSFSLLSVKILAAFWSIRSQFWWYFHLPHISVGPHGGYL